MQDQFFYRLVSLKEKFKNFSLNQFLKLSVVTLLAITFPFTVRVSQQQQEMRQRAEEINQIPSITTVPAILTPTPQISRPAY